MKQTLIVANWKSQKTTKEIQEWLDEIVQFPRLFTSPEKKIILCPPFPYLSLVKKFLQEHTLMLTLGAQNISPFSEGAYTGEVGGKQIKEFAEYVIVGHHERREYFTETNEMISRKMNQAIAHELLPIVCVQSGSDHIPQEATMLAYEPVGAIGTGHPDTPENANEIALQLKQQNTARKVLYGGSVTAANVHAFTAMGDIDGVLVGAASLEAKEFIGIIQNA